MTTDPMISSGLGAPAAASLFGRPRYRLAMMLLIALCALIAHGQSVQYQFVSYDDFLFVTSNEMTLKGLTSEGFVNAFTDTGQDANWVPITRLTHMLDVQLYGLDARGHHVTNVLFHTINAVLLWLLLAMLTGTYWRAAVAAMLFAVHPVHVESVAWISERRDVLSMFFGLLTLLAYLRYARKRSVVRYIPVAIGMLMAVMSKPSMVTLPCVMLLLDYWPLGRVQTAWSSDRRWVAVVKLVIEKLPLFAISLLSGVLTIVAQDKAIVDTGALPIWMRLVRVVLAYEGYMHLLFWPVNLSPLYPNRNDWQVWQVAMGVAWLLSATYVAYRCRARAAYLIVGWLWFMGTLVPMIGLLQVGKQTYACRYAYFSFIGLYLIIAWGPAALLQRLGKPAVVKLAVACTALVLVLLMAGSWKQTQIWQDDSTLAKGFIDSGQPGTLLAGEQAKELYLQGHHEQAKKLLRQAACYSLFDAKDPINILTRLYYIEGELDHAQNLGKLLVRANLANEATWENLGDIFRAQGDLEKAVRCYNRSIDLMSQTASVHLSLAETYELLNKPEEADAQIPLVLANPMIPIDFYRRVGMIYFKRADYQRAIALFTRVISHPQGAEDQASWYALGLSYSRTGQPELARNAYVETLKLHPQWAEVHNSLGVVLAQMGMMDQAKAAFTQAVKLDPDNAQAKANLARALGKTNPASEPEPLPAQP